jgi:hypothetical protein
MTLEPLPTSVDPEGEEAQRLRTALHEAGHAVAGVVLRLGLQRVSIVPDEDAGQLGVCHFRTRGDIEDHGPEPEVRSGDAASATAYDAWLDRGGRQARAILRRAPAQLVTALAGPFVEPWLVPDLSWDDETSAGDIETAYDIAKTLGSLYGAQWDAVHPAAPVPELASLPAAVLRAAVAETDRLVTVARPAVDAVMTALLKDHRVSGAQIRRVIRDRLPAPPAISSTTIMAALREAAHAEIRRHAA